MPAYARIPVLAGIAVVLVIVLTGAQPRATEGPATALTNGESRAEASRLSKITGAVTLSILRAPIRSTARRPASAPISSGEGRSVRQRVRRPSPPRSIAEPSPAIAEAESAKPLARWTPSKPALVTSRHAETAHEAWAPSVVLTP